jgi:hypothetical protein
MAKLLEATVAVGTLVGFLPRVNTDVLDQLMVGRERLETLLALVGLHLAAMGDNGFPSMHLHRRFVHEDLYRAKIIFCLNYNSLFLTYIYIIINFSFNMYCRACNYDNNKILTIYQALCRNLKYSITAVS